MDDIEQNVGQSEFESSQLSSSFKTFVFAILSLMFLLYFLFFQIQFKCGFPN